MNRLEQLLHDRGPSLTSDIAAILSREGKSPAAARQIVSRLPEDVRVLRGLTFPKRARFIYLDKQFGTDRYWDALYSAIEKTNPAYSAAIAAVHSRGGFVPLKDFEIVSGSPVKQKGQISCSTVLERLRSVDLLGTTEINGIGECVLLRGAEIDAVSLRRLRARLLTENVLLDAIRAWAMKMNMASPGKTRIRNETPTPQLSTCKFDLCGPCYLWPIRRFSDGKIVQGFFVADVVVGAELKVQEVAAFLRKCTLLGHLPKIGRFLPMLIADGFTPEALRECRSAGVITTRPDTLFGRDIARALGELLQTLSNSAAVAAVNPNRIEELFSSLSAIEGTAGNLRGALFELIVGHMVYAREGGSGSIDIGTLVTSPKTGQRAEIDVRLVKEREVLICECKGYQPSSIVQKEEIEAWLTNRIPIINSAHRAQDRFSDSKFRFEFWTSGVFHPEAVELLQKTKTNTKKYGIGWKDGTAVRKYADDIKAPGIRKMLDEHYISHPLADTLQIDSATEELPHSA